MKDINKQRMKYWGIALVIGILVLILMGGLRLAKAGEIERYTAGEEVNLILTCTINNAVPSGSATMNFTLRFPNGTIFLDNVVTTPKGNGIFNYTITFPDISGTYYPTLVCVDGENSNSDSTGRYEISPTGKELTSAKATAYTIILVISLLIFAGLLYFGLAIPSKNKTDEVTGYILAISNLKYLKYVILALSYISLIWISYFSWMIVYAYLDFEFLSNIFRFMFIFLVACTLPLFILFVYLLITNLIRDSKIGDMLQRGLRTKG